MVHSKKLVRNSLTAQGCIATPLARLTQNHSIHNESIERNGSDDEAILVETNGPTLANALPITQTRANAAGQNAQAHPDSGNSNRDHENRAPGLHSGDADNPDTNPEFDHAPSVTGNSDGKSPAAATPRAPQYIGAKEGAKSFKNQIIPKPADALCEKSVLDKVFGEPWDARVQRIRDDSCFGKHSDWGVRALIVKALDDLRQEQFAMQMMSLFQRVWDEEELPLKITTYGILATSFDAGLCVFFLFFFDGMLFVSFVFVFFDGMLFVSFFF
jgi:hypothetical protein